MRMKHTFLLLIAGGLLGPAMVWSQFGGPPTGFSKGGGPGGFDPSMIFDRMAKGKSTINRSELDEKGQRFFDMLAGSSGNTSGQLTREQFSQGFEKMRSQGPVMMGRGGDRGSFGGPPSMGGERGRGGDRMSFGGPPSMGGTPSFGGGMSSFGDRGRDRDRGGFGGPPSMGGGPPMMTFGAPSSTSSSGSQSDQAAEMWFRRSDRNGDGMLSYDEMSSRLQPERDKYDTNKDGLIDLNEYKAYFTAQFGQQNSNGSSPTPGQPGSNGTPDPNTPQSAPMIFPQQQQPEEEEKRPVVIRAGKLPKELPSWFERIDTDIDGQVGLYEWRRDGRNISEFEDMDLNGDGLLTPEEWIRFDKLSKEPSNSSGPSRAMMFTGGGPRDRGDRGDKGDKTERKGRFDWMSSGGGPSRR